MPVIETPDELAEQIADWCGVYGVFTGNEGTENHPNDCKCRMCFVGMVENRIRQSVTNEHILQNIKVGRL